MNSTKPGNPPYLAKMSNHCESFVWEAFFSKAATRRPLLACTYSTAKAGHKGSAILCRRVPHPYPRCLRRVAHPLRLLQRVGGLAQFPRRKHYPKTGCPTLRGFRSVGHSCCRRWEIFSAAPVRCCFFHRPSIRDVQRSQPRRSGPCYTSAMPNRLHRYYGAGYSTSSRPVVISVCRCWPAGATETCFCACWSGCGDGITL